MSSGKKYIMDAATAEKKMMRMTLEILENNAGEKELILVGVRESGHVLAASIQKMLSTVSEVQTDLISLTIDKKSPGAVELSKQMDFTGKIIIVIDDVANSGKTLLYALKPFLAFHPKKIQTLVLVERSHNSFPVHPDYRGLTIATTLQEHIYVEVAADKVTGAYME
jgi:pyrimidine operon attenuation protein/uracil phosphoribosyltransferase